MKFRNHSNYQLKPSDKESGGGISLTVPNMTLPLKTILERYSRGIEPPRRTPIYHGEEDETFHHIQSLDPMEKLDLAREIKLSVQAIQNNGQTGSSEAHTPDGGRSHEGKATENKATHQSDANPPSERSEQKPV